MDMVIKDSIDTKLCNMVSNFKIEEMKNTLLQMFENAEKTNSIYYIGELNKNDLMF
jgi:hypothetical protein